MKVLKIESLPANTWIDRDIVMVHSCFQLLKDCVEKEHVDTHSNYEDSKETIDEIRFLYNWWLTRMNKLDSPEDDEMLGRLMNVRGFLWT